MPRRMTVNWFGCEAELGDVPMMMARIAPRFANLRTVRLNTAGLTSFPMEIVALTGLTELWLRKNQLTSLPSEIGALTSLTELDLGENKLASLPSLRTSSRHPFPLRIAPSS